MLCLFCESGGPFTLEHVVPESLGNDDLVLVGQVCSPCNSHFSKLEELALQKTPLAFWRTVLGIKTKRGRLPTVDLSQPKCEKGLFPSVHPRHDDRVGFTAHDDGSTSVDIDDPRIVQEIRQGERNKFRFVMTPRLLFVFGRFLCKMGVELMSINAPLVARSERFIRARRFARFGQLGGLWPIFHFTAGHLSGLRRVLNDAEGIMEEVDCYNYSLFEFNGRYTLFRFGVGTDNWIVCLDDPFPTPKIREAFRGHHLQCIWYSPEEFR